MNQMHRTSSNLTYDIFSKANMLRICQPLLAVNTVKDFSLSIQKGCSNNEVGQLALQDLITRNRALTGPYVIDHDSHHAPYVTRIPIDGSVQLEDKLLISLTDEADYHCALAVHLDDLSPISGVGIDIASTRDFRSGRYSRRFFTRLFSPAELSLFQHFPQEQWKSLAATLFSAKEAAIKSIAPLVRHYEQTHPDEKLNFRIPDFQVLPDGDVVTATIRGESREHAAAIGVHKIVCCLLSGEDFAFTAAVCMYNHNE